VCRSSGHLAGAGRPRRLAAEGLGFTGPREKRPHQQHWRARQVAPAMTGHGEEERFEFGLDLLIAGMEAVSRR
jgi:hypothetical protein